MIDREQRGYPDDNGQVKGLEGAGAIVVRGMATLAGPGRADVTHDAKTHTLAAKNVVIAVGSVGKVPPGRPQGSGASTAVNCARCSAVSKSSSGFVGRRCSVTTLFLRT